MPNFIKEKSKNPSGNGEGKKEKTKIQQTPFIIILILVTFLFVSHIFLVTIHFNKKHHLFKSLSHLLVAQNICKAFLVNVIIMKRNLDKY